jgi:hypothetical protein
MLRRFRDLFLFNDLLDEGKHFYKSTGDFEALLWLPGAPIDVNLQALTRFDGPFAPGPAVQ